MSFKSITDHIADKAIENEILPSQPVDIEDLLHYLADKNDEVKKILDYKPNAFKRAMTQITNSMQRKLTEIEDRRNRVFEDEIKAAKAKLLETQNSTDEWINDSLQRMEDRQTAASSDQFLPTENRSGSVPNDSVDESVKNAPEALIRDPSVCRFADEEDPEPLDGPEEVYSEGLAGESVHGLSGVDEPTTVPALDSHEALRLALDKFTLDRGEEVTQEVVAEAIDRVQKKLNDSEKWNECVMTVVFKDWMINNAKHVADLAEGVLGARLVMQVALDATTHDFHIAYRRTPVHLTAAVAAGVGVVDVFLKPLSEFGINE